MALVFSYVMEDSWKNVILKAEVSDEETHNVSCIYHMFDWNRRTTLTQEGINQIYDIVRENYQIFSYKNVEFLPLLDGFVQILTFSDGQNEHTLKCLNLHYFHTHPEKLESCERARNVLSVFYQIRDILVAHGATPECFEFDCRWSPYVDDYYESDYFKFYPDDFFLKPTFMYELPSD